MSLTIASMLLLTVERHPDREAVVAGGSRWTYEAWNARINRAASSFFDLGIRPLDRVVICEDSGEAGLTSFMACQKLGAIAVPVSAASAQAELAYILQYAGARAIVYTSEVAEPVALAMGATNRHVILVSVGDSSADKAHNFDEMVATGCDLEPSGHASPEMTSVLDCTRGTGSTARWAQHTHANHVAIATACALEYRLTTQDRALHVAPPHHIGGLQACLTPHLLVGAANIIAGRYSVNGALNLIAEEHITSLHAAPTQIHEMFFHPALRLRNMSSLRTIITGGAAIDNATLERVLALGRPRLYTACGMAEASLLLLDILSKTPAHLGSYDDWRYPAARTALSITRKLAPT